MEDREFKAAVQKERDFIPSKNWLIFDDTCSRFFEALKQPAIYSPGIMSDLWFHIQRLRQLETRYLFPILPHLKRETSEQYLTRCIAAANLNYPTEWING